MELHEIVCAQRSPFWKHLFYPKQDVCLQREKKHVQEAQFVIGRKW